LNHRPAASRAWLALAAAAALSAGCSTNPPAAGTAPAPAPVAVPAPAPAPVAAAATPASETGTLVFATMKAEGRTDQGASLDGFAYSEKPGDASFGNISVASGVARVTGVIWPQKGSTWGGIGFSVGAAGGKAMDLSSYKTLSLQLAASAPGTLRIRVMGNEKATRDNGCYPVFVQPVTTELREYSIDLSRFASESYCGGNARTIAATSTAVAGVEVADPKVAGGKRDIDFQVGRITLSR
jgi:hypothetical protein